MRDAQSKLDQVHRVHRQDDHADDVATVLGLVGRDLLLDTVQAVADEDAPAAFALAARAVEMGYDLRAVCRELSRVVRDLLVLSVDPSRISDPEIAGEGERDRLKALVGRFSREDLLRAFDLLTRAEHGDPERGAAAVSPRDGAAAVDPSAQADADRGSDRWSRQRRTAVQAAGAATGETAPARRSRTRRRRPPAPTRAQPSLARAAEAATPAVAVPRESAAACARPASAAAVRRAAGRVVRRRAPDRISRTRSSREIEKPRTVFYNMVVAQAQKIEVAGDRVTFTFSPNQRALRDQFEQQKSWLESSAREAVRPAADHGGRGAD